MRRSAVVLPRLAVCVLLASCAQPEGTANSSFEEGTDPPASKWKTLDAGSTDIMGWTVTGAVDWIGTYWVAADGVRSIDLNAAGGGGLEMDFRTSVGQTYNVTFAMAGNPAGGPAKKAVGVSAAGRSEEFTFDVTGRSTQDMGWQDRSFAFTADGTTTTLRFVSLIPGIYGPALDNVRISMGEGR